MDKIGLESQAKIERREKVEADMERARRREMFRSYGLTDKDMVRTSEMRAGDPVGDYIGYPQIQAEMIADEKARRNSLVGKIESVVRGMREVIRR